MATSGPRIRRHPNLPWAVYTSTTPIKAASHRFSLADHRLRRNNPQAEGSPPEPPEALAENQFWRDFLDERDEILKLKWIDSKNEGRDIGFQEAIRRWLKHRPGWRKAHSVASA